MNHAIKFTMVGVSVKIIIKLKASLKYKLTMKIKQISTANETKFLELSINNNLSWKTHIECIKSKLSSACYVMRSVNPYITINILKMIYYPYFHSVMTYGLLFWGELPRQYKDFQVAKEDY